MPAWLAARAEPVASVRPAVLAVRRARQPSGITGLAVVNVLRTPARTVVGALSLAVGVTALAMLIAVTMAFRRAVVGTLLGNVVTVQVRGVDYVALGLAGAAVFARQFPPLLFAAAGAAVAAGVPVTCVAALLPAHLLRRLPGAQLLAAYRRTVGFVFQRYNLLPALTVLDNVIVPVLPYRTGWDKPGRGRELLKAVGLGGRERSLPSRMSGGEQQRVAIARALINTPHLLLADEPAGNLDTRSATGILDLLARLRRENQMTVIIATHDPQIAARCDRLIRLRDGAVIGDIEITDGHPVDETIRRVSQLG